MLLSHSHLLPLIVVAIALLISSRCECKKNHEEEKHDHEEEFDAGPPGKVIVRFTDLHTKNPEIYAHQSDGGLFAQLWLNTTNGDNKFKMYRKSRLESLPGMPSTATFKLNGGSMLEAVVWNALNIHKFHEHKLKKELQRMELERRKHEQPAKPSLGQKVAEEIGSFVERLCRGKNTPHAQPTAPPPPPKSVPEQIHSAIVELGIGYRPLACVDLLTLKPNQFEDFSFSPGSVWLGISVPSEALIDCSSEFNKY